MALPGEKLDIGKESNNRIGRRSFMHKSNIFGRDEVWGLPGSRAIEYFRTWADIGAGGIFIDMSSYNYIV